VVIFSNTEAGMSAPDGTVNILGNNPLGFGMRLQPPVRPTADQGPGLSDFVFDACLAYSSLGNLEAQAGAGETVPAHWGSDVSGRPNTDPQSILSGGSVHPIGGHKGFGLGLLVELLTGVLAGGASGDQIPAHGGINGHTQTVVAFDLAKFGDARPAGSGILAGASQRAADLANRLKANQPGLRLPGERSAQAKAKAEVAGISVTHETLAALANWSLRLEVSVPSDIPSLETV
jgi:LDH2 family malate/lactate/ureidoglycolate dehydrogenase